VTPLLLLDVDGVLNALADDGEHEYAWPQRCAGYATADGSRWPITWAPAVVERLRHWHEDGLVEIQWLTTWGHDANDELRRLLGLPRFVVAGTYNGFDLEGATADVDSNAHAGVAPSAPDPLSGHWWKYDVVRHVLDENPGRLVIWVDDELQQGSAFRRWADQQPLLRAIGPDPETGLSASDLRCIARWLEPEQESCPRCGGSIVPVAYGFPGPDMWEAAERGEIVLGGCMVRIGQPTVRCTSCEA
jgi:hypothetical protein